MKTDYVSTGIRLPVELMERLRQHAEDTYTDRSSIIRRAIAELLAREQRVGGRQ